MFDLFFEEVPVVQELYRAGIIKTSGITNLIEEVDGFHHSVSVCLVILEQKLVKV
jgi:hypothetical protein